jgi:hypothetical protein
MQLEINSLKLAAKEGQVSDLIKSLNKEIEMHDKVIIALKEIHGDPEVSDAKIIENIRNNKSLNERFMLRDDILKAKKDVRARTTKKRADYNELIRNPPTPKVFSDEGLMCESLIFGELNIDQSWNFSERSMSTKLEVIFLSFIPDQYRWKSIYKT